MRLRNTLAATLLALTVSAVAPHALYANWAGNAAEDRDDREQELYDQATEHIDDEEWEQAVKAFTRVAEKKGSHADGALYWTAYALNKLGRRAEALKTVDTLEKNYPSSKWIDDAKALEIDMRGARGERVSPDRIDDEDLKIIAINSLMHTDPERAYPLLEKIVRGPSDRKVKERALFILSQSSSPRAQSLMASIAKGNSNPDLQKDAVRYLGIGGGEHNRQVLAEMYASAASTEVKREVLRAFMISGDRARVLAAAKGEKDPKLRTEAIHLLGVMNGRAELEAMYAAETSRDLREEIIQALFISGDSAKLSELANNEKDPSLRSEAIRRLGLMGVKTGPLLLSLYTSDATMQVKHAVIDGLFVQGNAKLLIELSKKETDRTLRRDILQKLSVMNDEEAIQYMLQILQQ